jgi:hypothetical protein
MMKKFTPSFNEIIEEVDKNNLHGKTNNKYFKDKIEEMPNIVIYGQKGIGKYSQTLYNISKYSESRLKYEKKLALTFNKQELYFKISDIHYEIYMSLLGCNSKQLWSTIHRQIKDIISSKTKKKGIILCKNFHCIPKELLENFYSYIQDNNTSIQDKKVHIVYCLISECISFIPKQILNCCQLLRIQSQCKSNYKKVFKKNVNEINNAFNLNYIKNNLSKDRCNSKFICDSISKRILDESLNLNIVHFRELLYDLLIYNTDINETCEIILNNVINKKKDLTNDEISKLYIKTYDFLKYYNNNYRPIYHLELYFLSIIEIINRL